MTDALKVTRDQAVWEVMNSSSIAVAREQITRLVDFLTNSLDFNGKISTTESKP